VSSGASVASETVNSGADLTYASGTTNAMNVASGAFVTEVVTSGESVANLNLGNQQSLLVLSAALPATPPSAAAARLRLMPAAR